MAEVIRMPLLSDTMKEGVIAEWHKNVGDNVKADDVIADVETDKATMEVMPYVDGVLLYIGVEKGKGIPVNGIMAIIGKKGEEFKHLLDDNTASNSSSQTTESETTAKPSTKEAAIQLSEDAKAATIIRMPLLSDTMKEGKIVSWLKNVGDTVKSDDVLAEVETDKATMEVLPYVDGTLLHIGIPAGSAAKINEIIAIIGKAGTDVSGLLANESNNSDSNAVADAASNNEAKVENTTTTPNATVETINNVSSNDNRIKISPLARKIAKDKGFDINQISGTGDGGRIIKRDLDNFTPKSTTTQSSAIATVNNINSGTESYTDTPLSQMRKVIAQRLGESKFSAPHFYLNMSIKMDKAIEARAAMNAVSPFKISFNDFVIKACATALKKHPAINSSWMGDFIRQNHHIHIGTAVAVPEGLIVPVIKFADTKPLSEIANEAKTLIGKAKDKKLQPPEFTGNTFTISNLGMMDIDDFTAIINPPDSCILAVGKIEPTPVVENNEVVIRNIMKLTLSCDHRVVDGATGAAFLQTLKAYLENPVTMLV